MNEYRDVEASLLRFTNDFAEESTQFGMELESVYVDGFSSPRAWPEKDFVGPAELQVDFGDGVIYVTVAMIISTRDDVNLSRMSHLVNRLVNRLNKDTRIPMFDALSGTPRGHLVVRDGTRVGAKVETDTQPAKPIFINLVSDQVATRSHP